MSEQNLKNNALHVRHDAGIDHGLSFDSKSTKPGANNYGSMKYSLHLNQFGLFKP